MLWFLAGSVTVLVGTQLMRDPAIDLAHPANAQPTTTAGARGVFAFTGLLSKNTHGVFMVDVDTMTLWAYEYLPAKGCLRLAASRSWRYDRYLENYNGCDLPPDVVEQMVEEQRRYRLQRTESDAP